jgi:hypothetical protein
MGARSGSSDSDQPNASAKRADFRRCPLIQVNAREAELACFGHFPQGVHGMHARTSSEIQVWDPFVRMAHWTVPWHFFVAYLTEDVTTVHVWAGYVADGAGQAHTES